MFICWFWDWLGWVSWRCWCICCNRWWCVIDFVFLLLKLGVCFFCWGSILSVMIYWLIRLFLILMLMLVCCRLLMFYVCWSDVRYLVYWRLMMWFWKCCWMMRMWRMREVVGIFLVKWRLSYVLWLLVVMSVRMFVWFEWIVCWFVMLFFLLLKWWRRLVECRWLFRMWLMFFRLLLLIGNCLSIGVIGCWRWVMVWYCFVWGWWDIFLIDWGNFGWKLMLLFLKWVCWCVRVMRISWLLFICLWWVILMIWWNGINMMIVLYWWLLMKVILLLLIYCWFVMWWRLLRCGVSLGFGFGLLFRIWKIFWMLVVRCLIWWSGGCVWWCWKRRWSRLFVLRIWMMNSVICYCWFVRNWENMWRVWCWLIRLKFCFVMFCRFCYWCWLWWKNMKRLSVLLLCVKRIVLNWRLFMRLFGVLSRCVFSD